MANPGSNKWLITGRLKIIPIRPFGKLDENLISIYVMWQNRHAASFEIFTLHDCKNTYLSLRKLDSEIVTLRPLLLYSRDSIGEYLFEMIERVNSGSIFLINNKLINHQETRQEVRIFTAHLQSQWYNVFDSFLGDQKKVLQLQVF